MILQNFIVFEGIDGAGTSTQLDLLKQSRDAERFLFTAEPTGASTGLYLRQMLKGDIPLTNETAAYLFAADRNEHINGRLLIEGNRLITGVAEACRTGKIVVSDRYLFSSLAYQSINCDPAVPRTLNSSFPLPSLLFYFAIEEEPALARLGTRSYREIYEKKDFLDRVVAEYRKILDEYRGRDEGMKIIVLDAEKPKEEIRTIIWKEIAARYHLAVC